VNWHRTLLSAVLIGGCIWCLGLVHQVHSAKEADPSRQGPGYRVLAPAGVGREGAEVSLHVGESADPLKFSGRPG